VVGAFRVAAISALAAITLLLIGILRRALDVAMVLAPLLLSSLLTVLVSVVLHMSLNFANIIALPLLLGVGVSFNVYLVMGWRAGQIHPLDSAMARAVAFSALTTGTAFGSLALSHHPGTASMGELLLVSLACMVASTLLFLPALLASVTARPKKSRGLGGGSPPNLPG
jgi:predicted RND superfamily exporter protein